MLLFDKEAAAAFGCGDAAAGLSQEIFYHHDKNDFYADKNDFHENKK